MSQCGHRLCWNRPTGYESWKTRRKTRWEFFGPSSLYISIYIYMCVFLLYKKKSISEHPTRQTLRQKTRFIVGGHLPWPVAVSENQKKRRADKGKPVRQYNWSENIFVFPSEIYLPSVTKSFKRLQQTVRNKQGNIVSTMYNMYQIKFLMQLRLHVDNKPKCYTCVFVLLVYN